MEWVVQLLFVLRYLKTQDVIHKDLKPSNIIFCKSGLLKVIDFGMIKRVGFSNDFTFPVFGTPMYMAPEILHNSSYKFSVDMWSLGMTIYEITTGEHFDASNVGD